MLMGVSYLYFHSISSFSLFFFLSIFQFLRWFVFPFLHPFSTLSHPASISQHLLPVSHLNSLCLNRPPRQYHGDIIRCHRFHIPSLSPEKKVTPPKKKTTHINKPAPSSRSPILQHTTCIIHYIKLKSKISQS